MKAVITGWCGTTFAKMACHTLPLMENYARRHGHQFACVNLAGERPPSWMKVDALYAALQRCESAVWLDADVVVVDGSQWIEDAVPADKWQALVEHDTDCGMVPNCGVWVVRQPMMPVLADVWSLEHHLNHPWWEQAAVIELLGYHVTPDPRSKRERPSDLYDRTHFLPGEWNHHPNDRRRVAEPRFIHATQYADRLEIVKSYAARSA